MFASASDTSRGPASGPHSTPDAGWSEAIRRICSPLRQLFFPGAGLLSRLTVANGLMRDEWAFRGMSQTPAGAGRRSPSVAYYTLRCLRSARYGVRRPKHSVVRHSRTTFVFFLSSSIFPSHLRWQRPAL